MKNQVVLGIDPGIANCGIAVVQHTKHRYTLLEACVVKTKSKELTAKRLDAIYNSFCRLCDEYFVNAIAIERVYHNRNVNSSISTGKVIGLLEWTAYHYDLPVYLLTPQQVKAASGFGGTATKEQMLKIATRVFGAAIGTHHEADAALAALAGILKHRKPTS